MNGLKTKEEALELIYGRWTPHTETETVSIDECLGRVAAEDIYAQFNIPVVRSSAMDGIAVKSEMFFDETTGQEKFPDTENWVIGRDYVRADTGDDFDDAYDAVIAIEMAEILENGGVKLDLSEPKGPGAKDRKGPFKVRKGVNVRPAGSSVKQGELLISKGTYIRPEDIAAIAMGGSAEVRVMKKPVVAFIPTGSELVSAGTPLKRGQNYNSNAPMVKAMLTQMGAEPVIMPIVKDNKSELKASLEEAVKIADIVVISGGSSKGEEDFNTRLLDETGELLLHGVAAVPGRPTGIAIIDGKPVINTSGPAVACFYGMKWCIGSLVASCLETGSKPGYRRAVTLAEDLHTPPVMSVLVRLNVVETENGPVAQQLTGSRPGLIATMHTNAVFMSEIGKSLYPAGSVIEVEMRV
jgi:molybdopterin molybdotransferase/putative molybdopterin biosynthesis protein